jgi:hypothetical protein
MLDLDREQAQAGAAPAMRDMLLSARQSLNFGML